MDPLNWIHLKETFESCHYKKNCHISTQTERGEKSIMSSLKDPLF